MMRKLWIAIVLFVALWSFSPSAGLAQDKPSAPSAPSTAPPADEGGEGSEVYGFLAMALFACIIILVVCKSSRRS